MNDPKHIQKLKNTIETAYSKFTQEWEQINSELDKINDEVDIKIESGQIKNIRDELK